MFLLDLFLFIRLRTSDGRKVKFLPTVDLLEPAVCALREWGNRIHEKNVTELICLNEAYE